MSKILNRILNNLATRIIFIIYVFFTLVTVFFIVFGYHNELYLQKQRQYDKLKGIVSSVGINMDGDEHEEMMSKYSKKRKLSSITEDTIYFKINRILNETVRYNKLNSPMYTLVFDQEKKGFYYGVRSDSFIDLNNEYLQTPETLIKQLEYGGIIPLHESENGIWLSAFYPIKNKNGEVVALLEADIEFSEFKKRVNYHYLSEAAIVLFIIIIFFIFFILYTRKILRVEAHRNRLLETQKKTIELKNKDIMDSIHYALKIQNAMLPSESLFKKTFKENFIFYQPKDVVAGDFYWMECIDDDIFVAVADCTGHGVPGAILSIICSNALKQVVCETKIKAPGEILDAVRDLVISFLTKGEHEMNDGMDISLCKVNYKKSELDYAGAYNPIYIVRDGKMIISKPCKQPVGKFINQKKFKCSNFKIEKKDTIYLFTDGYADQFGGPNKKKFKYRQFKNLLLLNSQKPMIEQRKVFIKTFNDWRGNEEQIDDVCIVGIKL